MGQAMNLIDTSKVKPLHQGDGFMVGECGNQKIHLVTEHQLYGSFDGLQAVFRYQEKYQTEAKKAKESDDKHNNSDWSTFNNFKEAITTYKTNPITITKFSEKDDFIKGGGTESGKTLHYDVTGDMIDIGRYIDGEPEIFASLINGNPRGKRVVIYISLSYSWQVPASVLNYRAERITMLIDWLENQGIRTQVVGITSNNCIHFEVIVKHFDESLNITDIGIVSHSDFLRRVLFRFTEYSQTYDSTYGMTSTLNNYISSHVKETMISEYANEMAVFIGLETIKDKSVIKDEFDHLESDIKSAIEEDILNFYRLVT
jgi:hypothetical protein